MQHSPRCVLDPSISGRLRHGRRVHQADPRGRDQKGRPAGRTGVCCRKVRRAPAADDQGGEDHRLRVGARDSEVGPDPATGAIKIKYDNKPKTKDTWKDFTFDQGKISGWTGKTGPVKSVLWSRTTSDQSRGRKAELKSAYLTNSKALYAIVELSSSKATSWGNAEYTAKGDYRQGAFKQSAGEIAAGEKTLAYFAFENAKIGGVLHIPYYDEDGTSQGRWKLELPIK